jgi:hypothetical protein
MGDLVEQLRYKACYPTAIHYRNCLIKAADHIEELEAEVERLRIVQTAAQAVSDGMKPSRS